MALTQSSKIEVYTDGHCNLCRWMRARVDPLDRDRRIEWLDYNDPEILRRAARERARKWRTRCTPTQPTVDGPKVTLLGLK
jgi:predicted DCC family thiol-disulfide oxidoreductase YuxK